MTAMSSTSRARSPATGSILNDLRVVVGNRNVVVGAKTRSFSTGYRFGQGPVLAVVRPGSLIELWRTLQICVGAGVIIIMQSANTGLTGGSTPNGTYDREVVLINTLRIKGIYSISGGTQVVCLPGATLYELEAELKPLGREPHSVIGSSCIGASVFGGICNNSGGSLVQRGPAYTQLALYARVDEQGRLELVNNLGIVLGKTPEEILQRLDKRQFSDYDVENNPERHASDNDYCSHVRQVDAATPARFNADPRRLFEASGSAGKVALLAVRVDTFPKYTDTVTFYVGTNSVADLAAMRRDILRDFKSLPIAGEYIHREAFDVAARYGKDMFIAIERLGTDRLPWLFSLKAKIDDMAHRLPLLPRYLSDILMQGAGRLFRNHLPERILNYRDQYEHHLILKMGDEGVSEARSYLRARYPSECGDFFECSDVEARKAFLHRFVVAGAAFRYQAMHHRKVGDIIALDIALRRNEVDWLESLPESIDCILIKRLYYGHFFCHVFHQDYIVAKDADLAALKSQMLEILNKRGAEYPAEHNVGHIYRAKHALVAHYQKLDPGNCFNPGIGQTTRNAQWK